MDMEVDDIKSFGIDPIVQANSLRSSATCNQLLMMAFMLALTRLTYNVQPCIVFWWLTGGYPVHAEVFGG